MNEQQRSRGTVDRIVDEVVVVLLEGDEEEVHLPLDGLSQRLREQLGEGTVVILTCRGGTPEVVDVVDAETGARREQAATRLEGLRRERGGRRFHRPAR